VQHAALTAQEPLPAGHVRLPHQRARRLRRRAGESSTHHGNQPTNQQSPCCSIEPGPSEWGVCAVLVVVVVVVVVVVIVVVYCLNCPMTSLLRLVPSTYTIILLIW